MTGRFRALRPDALPNWAIDSRPGWARQRWRRYGERFVVLDIGSGCMSRLRFPFRTQKKTFIYNIRRDSIPAIPVIPIIHRLIVLARITRRAEARGSLNPARVLDGQW